MNGIKQIFGKEMARIFKDKKMVFSVFFLPVLIMILIMTIVSGLVSNMEDDIESHESVVYVANEPASFKAFLGDSKQEFKSRLIEAGGMEKAKKDILDGKADLIIEFPDGFEDAVGGYEAGKTIPQVKTYYNPSEDYSKAAYENISGGCSGSLPAVAACRTCRGSGTAHRVYSEFRQRRYDYPGR